MRNPIARVLGRAWIPLLLWLLMLTLPPTGRHRPRPAAHRRPRRAATSPRHRVPARLSPYAREQALPLDGARSPLERPYLTAASARAAQRGRRRALWLATVGVDVDRRDIHAGSAR
ncbi:hypothetical protein J3A78_003293 [Streptomyces sp. PvR006]|uniref:hypothetical protein n=1 Tax=Streptomyces sp. PvR006 TaxID=2817860 RepID=UPI001AE6DC00|nr:hypothetical protein [Streptomyces sp. PvR006]MBP2582815.1 hypothetical protein [Streptomyces sp. PvR006]